MLSIAHKIVTEGGGQLFVSFTFQPDEVLGDDDTGDVEVGVDARPSHDDGIPANSGPEEAGPGMVQ